MNMRLFLPQELAVGDTFVLPPEAHHHVINVCRAKAGDTLILFNGSSEEFMGVLNAPSKKHSEALIQSSQTGLAPSPLRVHLGLGISTGKRFDLALQKATELGVSSITPLHTEKSARGRDSEKKHEHWQRILISASEQSGRCDVPMCHPSISLTDWCKNRDEKLCLIASLQQTPVNLSELTVPTSLALLIGPASGFTKPEEHLACEQGFQCLSLGPRTLRTETACFSALSVLQYVWGDM